LLAGCVPKVDLAQVVSMVKEEVPELHIVPQLIFACFFVILIFIAAAVLGRLNFMSA
jgi:hypothetical protein